MSDEAFLKPWQIDTVHYIERYHGVTGAVPSDDDIIEYLKFTKRVPGINSESVESLKANDLFKASMDSRGIVINTDVGELKETSGLTAKQMAAAAVMLNYTDRRSDEKKLRDIGVSTEEFSTWMQDTGFAKYMRDRSELLVSNTVHEAHMGLLRGVRQGNTASIKLYYEMTGRYNADQENQVNIRALIGQVLEAIQKHVRDPDTLNMLAVELSAIAMKSTASPKKELL